MSETYITPEQVSRLEASAVVRDQATGELAPCFRDQLLIRLLFRLGCRVSEALGIEVEDIDFERGQVRIQHLKVRTGVYCPHCGERLSKRHAFCSGCGSRVEQAVSRELEKRKFRLVPLDGDTLGLVREYIEAGGPVERDGKRVLFGVSRHRAWQIVRQAAVRAGLPRLVNAESGREHWVSPHRLRDAFATHAASVDGSTDGMRALQEQLGHANFNTTMRYKKVSGREHEEWYRRLWRGGEMAAGQASIELEALPCQDRRR